MICLFNERNISNRLDASGGSASRNLLGAAKDALMRAAASTQPFAALFDTETTVRFNVDKIAGGHGTTAQPNAS